MHVVVVYKTDPAFCPSVVSTCRWLRSAGCDVALVCVNPSASVTRELESVGVAVSVVPGTTEIKAHPLVRVARWYRFAQSAWRHLDQLLRPDTILWIAGAETAVALGPALFRRKFVLHLFELYDREWRFRIFLRRLVRNAALVVVPESNRGALVRLWYQPRMSPAVIPNKSFYSRPQIAAMSLAGTGVEPATLQALFNQRRTLLYQGLIDLNERDLLPLARVMHQSRGEWQFVLMGHDLKSMDRIQRECPGAVHVPFVPPPYHLKITELAFAGAVSYSWNSLNSLYCAPNKIWEYALCRKPMLCNDVPGLVETVGRCEAGLCVDFNNEDSLSRALIQLVNEYPKFVRGSARLYDSFDAEQVFGELLRRLTTTKTTSRTLTAV